MSNNAVGRISFEGNDANAISAKKPVPPACPTVAYRSETAANKSVNIRTTHRDGARVLAANIAKLPDLLKAVRTAPF